ncbi:MAG: 2,3-diaminopropionate biosynthesis protein SbnB [Actinomycetota bacterium]|nr:2,3-diaminopropionate biosynthesis protein SbnB [Actinomycetota bacterium]
MFEFCVVPGAVVGRILNASQDTVIDMVRQAYLLHEDSFSVNPDSYFLRFPDKPDSRVIALPGYLGGATDKIGLKWIASFPGNVASGKPRASAVLLLNDYETGYPIACLEAAGISAARTAASAALGAKHLQAPGQRSVAFVGAGVIARTIADYLVVAGIEIGELVVFDRDPSSADKLVEHVRPSCAVSARRVDSLDEALDADLVVFATTAGVPYVPVETKLRPEQVVLNISLRDLPPEMLLAANNIVDDIGHCLKAQTSPHLAEQLSGNREFVNGTLAGVLRDEVVLDRGVPTIFSPFGLGILDIAVGDYVLRRARELGESIEIADFIGETSRW